MKSQLIIILTVILLSASICSADNFVGGLPLTTVKQGEVSGGVYFDSFYGIDGQISGQPGTIDKTFTLPSYTDIEWAMLLTTVYCGNMQNNYPGWANITFNDAVLGNESLNVLFPYKFYGGTGYITVNDHVNRVSSDYMMWYDVTGLIQAGGNTASVHTEKNGMTSFDGRIKLITLIVAYNDGSSNTIYYCVNRGHDVDSHYSESILGEDYIGSTSFTASLPSSTTLQGANLTALHIASVDGSYTFNSNSIANGTPQGTICGSNTWDVTSSFNPSGTNTMTYNRSGVYYKIALGILTAEYHDIAAQPDLLVSDISVKHNYYNRAWVNLSNTVNVTVTNNDAGNAGSFNVVLYADGAEVDTISVPGLAAGASTIVSFNWTPDEVKVYTLKAEVDPNNAVAETDEMNNELTTSQTVEYNGYMGDKPLTTYAHDIIQGNIIYTYGNSFYGGKLFPDDTYTVNHQITLPEGASVKFARLYNYWTWSYAGSTGKYPIMSLTFDGSTVSPDAQYDDRKGPGMTYDYPAGTWAYNVTSLVTGSGTFTTVITNTDPDVGSSFCMGGLSLLVVYEVPNGMEVEYWINEGADMINSQIDSGGLTPEEATVTSLFPGSVDLSNVDSAWLWTVVQSGGNMNNMLLFNEINWTGVYDGTPYSDLDIDEARAVENYLASSDNSAQIRAALYPGGDYLMPCNAFLVINYSGTPTPALSLSASPTTVTVGVPTDVTFTVTNSSAPVESAYITLSGSATGSGTTDASGTVVISVNATSEGTITATASKESYIGATTTLTAESENEGVSSSVSLSVDIKPAIALVVTPGNIDFGELSPGETSGMHTLTLENKGGYDISITADVTDTANNLFMDGLLLDTAPWGSYSTFVLAAGSDTADASLKVPHDYIGVGAKDGTLMFWATAL